MKIAYIAETSLNNMSAYTQHVLKMCDAFSNQNSDVELFLPKNEKYINFKFLKKKFLLRSKKKFQINSVLDRQIDNFFSRSYFAFQVARSVKKKI